MTQTKKKHFCWCCCWRIKCRLISFYLQLFFLSNFMWTFIDCLFFAFLAPASTNSIHRAEKLCPYRCLIQRRALSVYFVSISLAHTFCLSYSFFFCPYVTIFRMQFLNFTGYFIYLIFEMIVFWHFAHSKKRARKHYRAKQQNEEAIESVHVVQCTYATRLTSSVPIKMTRKPLSIFLNLPCISNLKSIVIQRQRQ